MASTDTNSRIAAALATRVDEYGEIDPDYREIRNVEVTGSGDEGFTLRYDTALGSQVEYHGGAETAEEIADDLEAQIRDAAA